MKKKQEQLRLYGKYGNQDLYEIFLGSWGNWEILENGNFKFL